MSITSEQRLQQLERLCGQLLAQNHRLIERNAKLTLELQALSREGAVRLPLSNVTRIPLQPQPAFATSADGQAYLQDT